MAAASGDVTAPGGGDLEADDKAGEREPLLPKTPREEKQGALWDRIHNLWRGPVVDVMTYKVDTLTGWNCFMLKGVTTAFSSSSAWFMLLKLLCLSLVMAGLVVLTVADPAQMKTSKFHMISVFLRIFVGLLLGFFLTSSVNRWFQCADGFLQIEDAIRNLQMQLLALGVQKDLRFKCVRYGVISNYLLARILEIEAMKVEQRTDAMESMWNELIDGRGNQEPMIQDDAESQTFIALTQPEADLLKSCQDPSAMVWIWVASLVGRMAQDGWIPPMASPTYGRIMNLVQAAHGGIRTVKLAIIVQAPFIYVHMLASLVHVNNIFNAISFGIVAGTTIGTELQRSRKNDDYSHHSKESDLIADVENLFISFVVSMIGPFLYQILLEVSLCLAKPFDSPVSQIPTGRLLDDLQRDLSDAMKIGTAPPSWEAPFLKAPVAPKVAEAPPVAPKVAPKVAEASPTSPSNKQP